MPPLICSFASKYSSPERIRKWEAHLENLRRRYPDDASLQEAAQILLTRAREWLEGDAKGSEPGARFS